MAYFTSPMTTMIFERAKELCGAEPEYLWQDSPDCCILRHQGSRKWFAVVMEVTGDKFGLADRGRIEILNVKCLEETVFELMGTSGLYPAFHMCKKSWMSVLLDGSVSREMVLAMLDSSYRLIDAKGKKKRKI